MDEQRQLEAACRHSRYRLCTTPALAKAQKQRCDPGFAQGLEVSAGAEHTKLSNRPVPVLRKVVDETDDLERGRLGGELDDNSRMPVRPGAVDHRFHSTTIASIAHLTKHSYRRPSLLSG